MEEEPLDSITSETTRMVWELFTQMNDSEERPSAKS